jgi:MFS family permease
MLSPAVPSFWWLLSLRFASGFGVGGTIPTMFAYASESLPLKVRERYIIFISMFWMTGALVVSAIAWGMLPDVDAGANVASDSCTRMWRPFLVVAAAPALACALLFHGALESPAFLVARGRDAEAVSVLMRIAHWRLRGAAASVTREALREAIQTSRGAWARVSRGFFSWYLIFDAPALAAREQGGSERDDLLAAAPDGPAVAVSSSLGDSRAADSDSEGVRRSSESCEQRARWPRRDARSWPCFFFLAAQRLKRSRQVSTLPTSACW